MRESASAAPCRHSVECCILPPGRTPIVTKLVADARRDEVLERVRAACSDGARAVRNPLATFKVFANFRVCFVTLEFFKWREIGILVGEAHHKTHRNLVIFQVIQE